MSPSLPHRRLILGTASLTLLLLGALSCDSKRHEKPYTPFGVASSPGATSATAPPESTPPIKPPFNPQKASKAPPNAHEWTLDGRLFRAQEGFVFERGLAADFTGDGKPDFVAWLVSAAAKPSKKIDPAATPIPGELWLYPDGSEPRRIATVPGFVPAGPGCKQSARLKQTGAQTVTLDVRARCESPLLPRAPVRAITVLAPGREAPEVFTLRVARVAGSENLRFRISSEDRDGDARDDVELTVAFKNKAKPDEAAIRFIWLDRKAGISRETSFPGKDFSDIASLLVVQAPGKNTSREALDRAEAVRRLFGAACAEGSVPVLSDKDGNTFNCNPPEDAIAFLATAEVRADLAQNSVGDAINALARAGWYGGPLDAKRYQELASEIEKAVTVKTLRYLTKPEAKPRQASSMPRFSPLTFAADGSLLIQTVDGVIKVNAESGVETDASEEIDPWPLTVISPRGDRLLNVNYPCDSPFISLTPSTEAGQAIDPIVTPLLAPRPGSCSSKRKMFVELSLRPIAWSAEGFAAFLGSTRIGPALNGAEPKEGAATSKNGKFSIVNTSLGLLVLSDEKPTLWRNAKGEHVGLSDCVIDDNGRLAACVLGERAQLLTGE